MFNPGDKVLVYSAPWDKRPAIGTIERATRTIVVLSNGNRYNREDGHAVPYTSGAGCIRAATTEQLAAIQQTKRIFQLRIAIASYLAELAPVEIEWLYGELRNRGMPEV